MLEKKNRKSFHIAPGHEPFHVRVYHRFCLPLAEAGWRVELAAQPRKGWSQTGERVVFHRLPGDYTLTYRFGLTERFRRVRAAYRLALSSRADVFTFHAPEFISAAIRLRQKTGKPVIFDCMEDFEGYALMREGIPGFLRWGLIQAVRSRLHRAARHLDAIVTADPATEEYFRQFGGRARLLTIYNFPDARIFQSPSPAPEKCYDLIYHGSFDRSLLSQVLEIDHQLVIKGFNLVWRLVGKCAVLGWFQNELAQRGAVGRFAISDSIPLEAIPAEVCRARIGIVPLADLPKYRTNIPQKIFEFMALGLPFVVSDLAPCRPFIEHGRCGMLADPRQPGTFADAVGQLLRDPELYLAMATEGMARFKASYHFDIEKVKLLGLYENMLHTSQTA